VTSLLRLPREVHQALLTHLLPTESDEEQAAFVYARQAPSSAGDWLLEHVNHELLGAEDFEVQHSAHIELADATRARVIKRAHELEACLVEWHSHPYPYPAAFSPSDQAGLREFVPHVRWRLHGRPYAAVVVAPSGSFDALAWVGEDTEPLQLDALEVEGQLLRPTELTLKHWSRNYGW